MNSNTLLGSATRHLTRLLILIACIAHVSAQGLPTWTPKERELLRKGELIPGAALLVEEPEDSPLPHVAPEPEVPSIEPVVPEDPYDPKIIPQEYLAKYFKSSHESYLIDPQRLLSKQHYLDREGFLEYHAHDSKIEIKMYLFDALQEIPQPYTLQKLVSERYADGDLTAVVFYFLGNPSRNLLAFGGKGASEIPPEEVQKILHSAKVKAMEKSDPSIQIESFIVQLSIKLYWLEQSFAKTATTQAVPDTPKPAAPPPPPAPGALAKVKPYLLYIVVGGMGVLISLLSAAAAWVLWRRSRIYHFPVLEIPKRLGANYAAGVGAVIAFHDRLGSPSNQRDQVPDYLTRM